MIRIEDATDDRMKRRIVRNYAEEVIRSHGENNSVGKFDRFIRRMMDNWADSGMEDDVIIKLINNSYIKEFGE